MEKYNPKTIEPKWQEFWEKYPELWQVKEGENSPKFYCLDMFPYPSGAGLHVGHVENYTATDIYSRFLRMNGYNVLRPMGWDAFGLPAENYAIKSGIHPDISTHENIKNFIKQIKNLGLLYDWSREIDTSSPEYYRWTQWFFLFLYKHGLAYKKKAKVNWCESCQTVLSNEQAEDGICERCKNSVKQKEMEQWFFKVTDFLEDQTHEGREIKGLINGLDTINWPESTRAEQLNWIGKSEGVKFRMVIENTEAGLEVFTTRIDTVFGVTYAVISPEHPLLGVIKNQIENWKEVGAYLKKTQDKTDLERIRAKEKTGVELKGIKVVNPFNQKRIPLFVADYVLGHYGTGAVMAVPAHDERDFEFAEKYSLPVIEVVQKKTGSLLAEGKKMNVAIAAEVFVADGILFDSGEYSGLTSQMARRKMTAWLEKEELGAVEINYKLRDWLVSRQRYWGAPIPIIYCPDCGAQPVPEKDLPVLLPTDVDFKPTGESPLALSETFHKVNCPVCGQVARRESDTMDTFVCSSWYFLRFIDPNNKKEFASRERMRKWMPVDLYMGGAEHAVLHLIYARFFTKALKKFGYLDFDEPFAKLRHQGTILGEVEYTTYRKADGELVDADLVKDDNNTFRHKEQKIELFEERVEKSDLCKEGGNLSLKSHPEIRVRGVAHKMSKSRGNVVNPDDIVSIYGADALRLYEMFMGPLEEAKAWNTDSIVGLRRFLEKVWKLQFKADNQAALGKSSMLLLHKTTRKVTQDIGDLRFNTAISALMILVNALAKDEVISKSAYEQVIVLLSPFAPHIAEEIWERLDNHTSVGQQNWPQWEDSLCVEEVVEISVQVDGKIKAHLTLSVDDANDQEKVERAALEHPKLEPIRGKEIFNKVFVPGKIISFVTTKKR